MRALGGHPCRTCLPRQDEGSGVTPAQWRLASRIVTLLASEIGLTDQGLAVLLDVSMAELVPVLRVLYRQRRIDRCWSYTVLVPHAGERRWAA
jgi:hypothetical protein